MLLLGVEVVAGLSGLVVLGRDHEVSPTRPLLLAPVDRRVRAAAVVQRDHRGIAPQGVVFGGQQDGVIGRVLGRVHDAVDPDLALGRGVVVPWRGHPLSQPGHQVEPLDRDRLRRLVGELELVEPPQGVASGRRVVAGEVVADQVAGLPVERGGLQVGDGGVGADDEARHRQGEPRLVGRAGLELGLLGRDEAVADGVGRLGQSLDDLDERLPPGHPRAAGDALGEPPERGGQRLVGGGLCLLVAELVADRDQDVRGDVPGREGPEPHHHVAELLRPAADIDLVLELRRLELADGRPRVGEVLAELGEVVGQDVELGLGLGIPLGLDQEPGDAEPFVLVGPLDLGQQAEHDLAGNLPGRELAQPEAVHPAELDQVRAELVDRLLHPNRLARPRPEVGEDPASLVVPGFGLDPEDFLGHHPAVYDQRLDELEGLEVPERVLGIDPRDLGVADHDPLEAVEDPDDGVVAVHGPSVDRAVLHHDVVADRRRPQHQDRQRRESGESEPSNLWHAGCPYTERRA